MTSLYAIVSFPYLICNILESLSYGVFVSPLICYAQVCSKYEDLSVQRFYSSFKLIRAGYSSQKLQTAFRNSMVVIQTFWHVCVTYVEGSFTNIDMTGFQYFEWMVTGATCGAGNAHSFQNTWFHCLWVVHDFTHSLYMLIHYRVWQSWDYVYGLMIAISRLIWFYKKLKNCHIKHLIYTLLCLRKNGEISWMTCSRILCFWNSQLCQQYLCWTSLYIYI